MEQMLALKAQNVRVLPQMRKHEHSKYFLKFSYDLHYMLSLKAKNQQPPASLPSWFSMIYHSHYSPGKPLPEQPKSDDVRFFSSHACWLLCVDAWGCRVRVLLIAWILLIAIGCFVGLVAF